MLKKIGAEPELVPSMKGKKEILERQLSSEWIIVITTVSGTSLQEEIDPEDSQRTVEDWIGLGLGLVLWVNTATERARNWENWCSMFFLPFYASPT